MKIGPESRATSAISTSNPESIIVRGFDLTRALVGTISFTDHFWLLLTGQLPTPSQRAVLDAVLVSIAEHGLVPSVQAARLTYAAAPEALQGAVAAGLLGCGSVILGSAQTAGEFLSAVVEKSAKVDLRSAALDQVSEWHAQRRPIPGFGHPLHKAGDPRVHRLYEIANKVASNGRHIEAAQAIESIVLDVTGRDLRMNVSVAIPAVLLDAGYPLQALKGAPLLARAAGLIAHLLEEQMHPIGFLMSHAAASAISYDGAAPDGFVSRED